MKSYRDIVGDGGSNVVGQVSQQLDRLNDRLASVKHIVAVMSGKGGVGKSSIAANIATALALGGDAVGVLDADINGSSIPMLTGTRGRKLEHGPTGIVPPTNACGMRVMSIDLMLQDDTAPVLWDAPTQQDAYTWRAMMEMGAVRELLSDTEWGALDFLIVDLPPGTDKLPNLVGLLPRMSGTVIVTIPSGVSQFVVGKSMRMADTLETPVIGIVENMAAYVCEHCGEEKSLFPGGQVEALAEKEGVPYLGTVPFDPRISAATGEDSLFMSEHSDTPAGRAIQRIANDISKFVDHGGRS